MKQPSIKEQKKRYPCFKCEKLKLAKIYIYHNGRPLIKCQGHFFEIYAPDYCQKFQEKKSQSEKSNKK